MKPLSCDRTSQLLSDLLASALEAGDAEALSAHLACCDLCRARAEALTYQDRLLAELAGQADLAKLSARIHDALHAAAEAIAPAPKESTAVYSALVDTLRETRALPDESMPSPVPSSPAGRSVAPGRPWRWVFPSAAAVLVGIPFLLPCLLDPAPPAPAVRQPQAIARLERVEGKVYVLAQKEKVRARQGQELFPGQQLHVGEDGAAVVIYPDTTRLELGAATRVAWPEEIPPPAGPGGDAGKKLSLEEGVLTADVAEQPGCGPMVVCTPHVEVAVPASRVVLQNSRDATVIELEKGTAHLKRKQDEQPVTIGPGAYRVDDLAPKDSKLRPLRRPTGPPLTLPGHHNGVWSLAFSPDGSRLATGDGTGFVRLWEPATGQMLTLLAEHKNVVRALAFTADGKHLASASDQRTVHLWDVAQARLHLTCAGKHGPICTLQFSPDGQTLAAASWSGAIHRWNTTTGKHAPMGMFSGSRLHRDVWGATAFSGDGRLLAWGSTDKTARVYEVATGTGLRTFEGHSGAVVAAAFSPDGKLLATGSRDRTVKLWEVATGTLKATLRGHRNNVQCLAFAPDGSTLASGSADATVKLWRVDAALEVMTIQASGKAVQCLAFSPDGRTLSSGSQDGTVRLWALPAPQ